MPSVNGFTVKSSIKKVALCLVLLGSAVFTTLPVQAQDADKPVPDKWALVVGISEFQDKSMNLQYPAKDATDFYNYLINEAHFAKDHVRLLLNEKATRENILSQVGDRWLPRVVAPDDLVVIYISSHGSPSSMDVVGANYVVAHNTDREQLYATGVPMNEFAEMIKQRVHTDRVVLILDACHSGAANTSAKGLVRSTNFNAEQIPIGSGQLVICSSAPDQVSWESKRYQNGVFTHHLIDSLRKNPKLNDSYTYLKNQVQTEVLADRGELQVPALKTKWTGSDLILATVPTNPRPGIPETPTRAAAASAFSNAAAAAANPAITVAATPSGSAPSAPVSVSPAAPVARVPVAQPTAIASAQNPLRLDRPNAPAQAAPPTAAVSIPAPAAVAPAAVYGEYASNGKVKMKMLDVEKRMTGTFYTLELQNVTAAPISVYNFKYYLYDKGYLQAGVGGSEVSGSDTQLPPGAKTKIYFSGTTDSDAILVKCDKPGWGQMRLRTGDEPGGADTCGLAEQAAVPPTQTSAAYGQYASNGHVQMKVTDIDPKMTGYFVTAEVLNLDKETFEPYYMTVEFYKDGYLKNKVSGGSLWFSAHYIVSGLKAKITANTYEGADQVIVRFPKPGWAPITLQLAQ